MRPSDGGRLGKRGEALGGRERLRNPRLFRAFAPSRIEKGKGMRESRESSSSRAACESKGENPG